MRNLKAPLLALVAGVFATGTVLADEIADFYQGKTITIISSSSPGGGYDTFARLIARHIGKHIPGNPDLIVQNMPGAGGIVATNYLYNIVDRDGSVIGSVQNNTPFEPLFGTEDVQYDPAEFNWLGTPSVETGLITVWHTSPAETIEDAQTESITVGATGANSTPSFYARVLNATLDTQLEIINGYPGQNEVLTAMEQEEIEGTPSLFYSSLMTTRPAWLADGLVRILLQYGPERVEALGDVPFANDIVTDPEALAVMDVAFAPLAFGRPFLAPPGVPEERVEALRDAFEAVLVDPDFLAEAESLNLDVASPRTGAQLAETLSTAYAASPEIVERVRAILRAGAAD